MKVEIVSGIWPPDVGGPASHAPEVARWLSERGHVVEAVVTAERKPAEQPYRVRFVSRRLPRGVRHARVFALVATRARHADVVYSTGMFVRSAAAAAAARTPIVLKLTSDPAFERARRAGLVDGGVTEFQRSTGSVRVELLRSARDSAVRHADHVVCPSGFLRDLVVGWGVPVERVTVLPNPAPRADRILSPSADRTGPFVFAGRLTDQKDLGVALRAVARVDAARLDVIGDGPDRVRLEELSRDLELGGRVRFLGALPRDEVLAHVRGADAVVLSSAWENFPHGVVESLAFGTPVIATRVGGVPEVVRDGENGLLVAPGDSDAFAAAVGRFLADRELRARLRAAAASSVAGYSQDRIYGRLEAILESVRLAVP
jgi:glycosyltransferase involved in cell wall biosynthesis